MTNTLLINLGVVLSLLTLVWIASLWKRDASIIDPVWGLGFVVVAGVSLWLNQSFGSRQILLTCLVAVWGIRLSIYLAIRNWGHEEDRRYRAMRDKHGNRFWWVNLFTVFWLQSILLWLISMPIQVSAVYQNSGADVSGLIWIDYLGAAICLIGIYFETVSDWQLARFKADPDNEGKVLDSGLWRYSRHPNYFGDFCVWWGFYLIAISAGAGWTIASPLLMSLFLMKVSGVPMLEKDIRERRPEYATYVERTNAFFPGPKSK